MFHVFTARSGSRSVAVAALLALCGSAAAQDSVANTPGGNDALSAYNAGSQRVRYVVDLVNISSSWGNAFSVAPLLKTSRDVDPLFSTQIPGSAAVSGSFVEGVNFASKNYSVWSTAGAGVSTTSNTAAGLVAVEGYDAQFTVGLTDFAVVPSNITGAIVGRSADQPARLYVERVIAASSRSTSANVDTSTLSLGGVDHAGNVYFRADSHVTGTSSVTLLGENILRVSLPARGGSVNLLYGNSGNNFVTDTAASTYVLRNETATPLNVPTGYTPAGGTACALIFDFANAFRAGSSTATVATVANHLDSGIEGHRGNPAFSPLTPIGGVGTMASLAKPAGASTVVNAVNAWAIEFASPSNPPAVVAGSNRSAILPSPITAGSFSANAAGDATFEQYQSQTAFRGGTGQVGIGTAASGRLVLAATATDPNQGSFIAAATFDGTAATWSVVAHPGQAVLDGAGSETSVGTLISPGTLTAFSAPAVDGLGNVYFVAAWKPTTLPATTGLFKAVNNAGVYELELLLTVGQQVTGANSATAYTIASLELADSDSIASGSLFSQQVIQSQFPGFTTTDAASPLAFGGVAVNATLDYDRGSSITETYDALLVVAPQLITIVEPTCPADFNGDSVRDVADLFAYINAWLAKTPDADFNDDTAIDVADLFAYINAWLAGC